MTNASDRSANEIIQFLLESGPDDWEAIPQLVITPDEYAALLTKDLESQSRGIFTNFGEQSWVQMRLQTAIATLTARAMKIETWAIKNGRFDLIATVSQLAFSADPDAK